METVQGGVPPYVVKETLVVNGKWWYTHLKYIMSACWICRIHDVVSQYRGTHRCHVHDVPDRAKVVTDLFSIDDTIYLMFVDDNPNLVQHEEYENAFFEGGSGPSCQGQQFPVFITPVSQFPNTKRRCVYKQQSTTQTIE